MKFYERNFLGKGRISKAWKRKNCYIARIGTKTKGKEPMELLELLPTYSKKLSGGNPIAPAEREALLVAMEESLENQEKVQFQRAVQMLKMMGKL